jgi:hypothetical protein
MVVASTSILDGPQWPPMAPMAPQKPPSTDRPRLVFRLSEAQPFRQHLFASDESTLNPRTQFPKAERKIHGKHMGVSTLTWVSILNSWTFMIWMIWGTHHGLETSMDNR